MEQPWRNEKGTDTKPRTRQIIYKNAILILAVHLLGVWGTMRGFIDLRRFLLLVFGWYWGRLGGWGITVGAHRLFSHRSYRAKPLLRNLLILTQTVGGQVQDIQDRAGRGLPPGVFAGIRANSLWTWVRDHRQHHQYSDTIYDPHNSKRGFFYSHIGWLMMKADPEVREKRKTVDMSDLEADPLIMLQHKYYVPLYITFALILPSVIGYCLICPNWWDVYLIVGAFRQMCIWNITFLVNSWAHHFGNKPYNTKVVPYEAHLVSMLTDGEGWHNYHHSFPFDYRAGEIWSLSTFYIETAARLGLAYELRTASEEMIAPHEAWTAHALPDGSQVGLTISRSRRK